MIFSNFLSGNLRVKVAEYPPGWFLDGPNRLSFLTAGQEIMIKSNSFL